ncbi:type 1 glutamine amidotransferase [Flammeovirga agarivorans]|uniref:GMP synthase n=1 Tax=Flammeovirga agarivorans TaxID=2726742 RepID=A0A7X8SL92_9BACT|nr:GMP synthase [Flammeovirga agarivorans]NLR92306.1 GMP synthase [Flammeovirga agarivorans]
MNRLRLAIIDMYNKFPNEGMRCIKEIVEEKKENLSYKIYDLRAEGQLPDDSYDIYISSGGPGDPSENEGWEDQYFDLLEKLWNHNLTSERKKYVFFICHSFQMASRFFKLGTLSPRNSTAFGAMSVHKTKEGKTDPILSALENIFYVIDSRDYQLLDITEEQLNRIGAQIVCLEKKRPHTTYQRAVMAIRYSEEFFGTQFHPEAEAASLLKFFGKEEQRKTITEKYGEEKYNNLIDVLEDPDRINLADRPIISTFLNIAIEKLQEVSTI